MYGKQTECAIAVMSRLAEVYDGGKTKLSAQELAENRGLPRPFVSKTLTALGQAGLIIGSRGPGGGCSLAMDPSTITLFDVFRLFERDDNSDNCPFGGGRCGLGAHCAIHEKLVGIQNALDNLLLHTTFQTFVDSANAHKETVDDASGKKPTRKRKSYRASDKS